MPCLIRVSWSEADTFIPKGGREGGGEGGREGCDFFPRVPCKERERGREGERTNAGVHEGGESLGGAVVLFEDFMEHIIPGKVQEGVAVR